MTEKAARKFVDATVARYGAGSALARARRMNATPVFVIKHFEPSVEELFDAVRLKVRGPSLP